jgi:hypothetical protein
MSAMRSPNSTVAPRSRFFRDAARVAVFGARHGSRAVRSRVDMRCSRRPCVDLRALPGLMPAVASARAGSRAVHHENMKNKPGCGVL